MVASSFSVDAQKVFSCNNRYDADIKVFVVENRYDAPICWFLKKAMLTMLMGIKACGISAKINMMQKNQFGLPKINMMPTC